MSILVQELDARKSRIASLESQISQIQSELARSSVPESGSGHSRDESSDVNRKEADPINFDRHVLEQYVLLIQKISACCEYLSV